MGGIVVKVILNYSLFSQKQKEKKNVTTECFAVSLSRLMDFEKKKKKFG